MSNEIVPAPPSSPPPELPPIEDLILKTPLYTSYKFTDSADARKKLDALRRSNFKIDAHCIYCKSPSVFDTKRSVGAGSGTGSAVDPGWMLKNGQWTVELQCARSDHHRYRYIFSTDQFHLRKIGQWPSLEDIAGADIEKYRPLLKGGYFRELKLATGLASHGVGIGAFVYLRRIFEKLIFEHHDDLPSPVEGFATMRMDEKIDALKAILPPALVAHKAAYSILSKGLHELDEETCQQYFPVVRSAIIRVLEQDFERREREKADAALAAEIAKINQDLKRK